MKKLTNLGKNQLTTTSTNNKNSNASPPSNTNTNNQIYPIPHKRVKSYFTLKNVKTSHTLLIGVSSLA